MRLMRLCGWTVSAVAGRGRLPSVQGVGGRVNWILKLAREGGLGWKLPAGLDEAELEERRYGRPAGPQRSERRAALDFAGMRKELAAAVAGGQVAGCRWVRPLAGMQDCTIAGVENGTPQGR